MSTRAAAVRYARALFDVARQEADPAAIRRDLVEVVRAIDEHPDLARALRARTVPEAARRGIIVAVAERLGVSPPVLKLVALLADRGRLALLPDIAAVYTERLLEHQNILPAEVTTAVPLPEDAAARLEAALRTVTGKQIAMRASVDPSLLGGVIARVGSTVYDGSVRTQLKKMRDQLVARG